MRFTLVLCLALGLALQPLHADACTAKPPKGDGGDNPDEGGPDEGGEEGGTDGGESGPSNPIEDKVGIDSGDLKEYDQSAFDEKIDSGEFIETSDDLLCTFDGDCCWGNEFAADSRDYRVTDAEPDADLMAEHFNAPPVSDPPYLVTAGSSQPSTDEAHLVSCPIECSKSNVIVTLEFYVTSNPTIELCYRDNGVPDSLRDCQSVKLEETPGPTIISLPPVDKPSQIVIVSSGFVGDDGDVVMIDSIAAGYDLCDEGSEEEPDSGEGGGGANDDATLCAEGTTDGEGLGGWTDSSSLSPESIPAEYGSAAPSEFKSHKGLEYKGPNTGGSVTVFGPSDGDQIDPENPYLVCDIKNSDVEEERQSAAMVLDNLEFTEDRQLEFDWYDGSYDTSLAVCLDEMESCELVDEYNPDFKYLRTWHTAKVLVPAGTQRVIIAGVPDDSQEFHNENSHLGVDNIRWTRPPGGGPASSDPEDNSENVCDA